MSIVLTPDDSVYARCRRCHTPIKSLDLDGYCYPCTYEGIQWDYPSAEKMQSWAAEYIRLALLQEDPDDVAWLARMGGHYALEVLGRE